MVDIISFVGRIVLVVSNIILLLISTAMIAVGAIILARINLQTDLLDGMRDSLDKSTDSIGVKTDSRDLSLNEFIFPVAYFIVIVGCVTGILALLGCIGGFCNDMNALFFYVLPLTLLFLAQLIFVLVVFTDVSTVDSTLKPYMKGTLESYGGFNDTSSNGLAWNAVMNFYDCCGVDDYRDFKVSKNWPPTELQELLNLTVHTPIMCCKNMTVFQWTCATDPDSTNNNWKSGCYVKLRDLVLYNALIYNGIILILTFQFPPIFFAVWILYTFWTADVGTPDPPTPKLPSAEPSPPPSPPADDAEEIQSQEDDSPESTLDSSASSASLDSDVSEEV